MSNPASDPLFSPLVRKLERETLKYAVGRAISCPSCEGLLDYRRAVLVEHNRSMMIRCAPCFDRWRAERLGGMDVATMRERGAEITDGREL